MIRTDESRLTANKRQAGTWESSNQWETVVIDHREIPRRIEFGASQQISITVAQNIWRKAKNPQITEIKTNQWKHKYINVHSSVYIAQKKNILLTQMYMHFCIDTFLYTYKIYSIGGRYDDKYFWWAGLVVGMWVLVTVTFWFEMKVWFLSQRNGRKSIKRLKSYQQKVRFHANCKEFEEACIKCWVIYLNKTIREHLNTLIHKICICLIIPVKQAVTRLREMVFILSPLHFVSELSTYHLILAINYFKLSTLRKKKKW